MQKDCQRMYAAVQGRNSLEINITLIFRITGMAYREMNYPALVLAFLVKNEDLSNKAIEKAVG